jgi:protein-tyrosine phosphatase
MAREITLPDGTRIRGRGLRDGPVPGPAPDFGLYLGTTRLRRRHESSLPWPHAWVSWPDFLIPLDSAAAITAIRDVYRRARDGERVEVACNGGVGRTGTVIACLAVLSGLPAAEAIRWTRANYHPHAIETPWQRRWIRRIATR